MRFKGRILTPLGTLYLLFVILVCLFAAYLLLLRPPRAEAIKTMEVELGDTGGVYDGKLKIYRDTDNVLVLEVDSVRVEIQDNDITINAKLLYRVDGQDVAVADGGTGKSSGTQYAIPYYNTATTFGEIAIGAAGKFLQVNPGANGYQYSDPSSAFAQLVTVAKSGADFTDIQAAIDSITDSSSSKPYAVLIYPGVYTISSEIDLDEDYVALVGIDFPLITWDSGGDSPATVHVTGANCSIHRLKLQNTRAPTDASKSLYVENVSTFLATNCFFYGSGRDTIQHSYGSGTAKFIDCYFEGYSDIAFITMHTFFHNCQFYITQSGQEAFFFGGQSGGSSPHIRVVNCFFDGAGSNHIANFNDDTTTLYFYGNHISENITAYSSTGYFEFRGHTPTIHYTRTPGGLNVGTATGAGIGDGNFSGSVDLDVKLTHTPPSATNRTVAWTVAHWPGSQRQWFAGKMWYAIGGSGTVYYYAEIKVVGGNHFYGAIPKLKKLTVYYYTVDDPDYITSTAIAYQNLGAPGVTLAYTDNTDRGLGSLGYANYSIEPNITLSQDAPYYLRFAFVQGTSFDVKLEAIKAEIDWE